eukprot:UN29451
MPIFRSLRPGELPKCNNLYTVTFSGTVECTEFILYNIDIETHIHTTHWTIQKRYSEIRAFHDNLRTATKVELPEIPGKIIFFNRNTKVIEKRRGLLEQYFIDLMHTADKSNIIRYNLEAFFRGVNTYEISKK